MNLIVLFALAATVAIVTAHISSSSHHTFKIPTADSRFLRELEMDLEMELEAEEPVKPVARYRRVPQQIMCGRKLAKYVLGVCGGVCTADTGLDIATTCCATQCGEDYIRKACCP